MCVVCFKLKKTTQAIGLYQVFYDSAMVIKQILGERKIFRPQRWMKCPVDICHLGIQLSGMVLCGKWHFVLFWLLYMVYFKENAPVKGAAEKK